MANSRRSSPGGKRAGLVRLVEACLRGTVQPGDRLLVGLSGGLDSVVLLDILGRIARRRRIRLSALHVNHQLSPNAPAWERFCRRACRERSIPFRRARVRVAPGDSVEASARAARYAALLAQPAEYVALAHHQDDQAETVLLQLLRGAGVRGLAAMPTVRIEDRGSRIVTKEQLKAKRKSNPQSSILDPQSSILDPQSSILDPQSSILDPRSSILDPRSSILDPTILRPLLDVSRSEIERYARQRKLSWVEDESNRDTRFARNFVRHELLPVLAGRFPSYRETLARSARHLGEAARLLDELAEIDAAQACREGVLAAAVLRACSPARARNLLRWFLGRCGVAMPNTGRLDETLRQIVAAKEDARVKVDLAGHDLYRWKGGLHLVPRRESATPFVRPWRNERRLSLPELGGVLRMARGTGPGIGLAKLKEHAVVVRARTGGERLQPDCSRPRRTLKNLFQERGVPPWVRDRVPLLFCGADLVWVPGIGVDCAYRAAPREPSLKPAWLPGAP